MAPPSGGDGDGGNVLAGTVTNSLTGGGLANVSIALDPPIADVAVVTGDDGTYSQSLPVGVYTLTFEDADGNFESQTTTVSVVADQTATADAALIPVAPVIVSTSVAGEAVPGGTVTVTADVVILDGSTLQSLAWSQSNSVTGTIQDAGDGTVTFELPSAAVYKEELLMVLSEPPISEEQLPPNVPVPEGEFPGGLQDRFQIVGMSPFALEEAGIATLAVTVTTTSGTYEEDVEIHAELPWKPSTGLHNVPIGNAVLLYGKTQDAYDWALSAPGGSGASLTDGNTQSPYFTPDASGLYRLTVTDATMDPAEEVTLELYAGTWEGAISGQDADGRPLAASCTVCHNGTIAGDTFTPWAQTGHAEIFTDSFNTSDHYSTSCLPCHTVGFDPGVDNGGFDDADDYQLFLDTFTTDGSHFHPDPNNWSDMLATAPATAQLGNIQCENCHGPQNGGAHTNSAFRASLSSDVCAVCHGEPLRHGRFQQWQLSGHANYELAIDESGSGSCARCHTGNGFLAWLPVLLDDDPATDPLDSVEVTWTADEAHPMTCVVCHDPHAIGTVSGNETDATVWISGETPPLIAGYTVAEAGRGALCMTCHNSRRGLRNDDNFAETVLTDAARAPHGSAQTDVLVGENAYFVEVGIPGSHALVEDTCVNCHMEKTPPPDLLAYNLGGSNHTFYARNDICSECHGELADTTVIEATFEASSDELLELIEEALAELMADQIAAGNSIDLNGEAAVADMADVADIMFGESHGRQAITVTFADGMAFGPYRMNDVDVLDGGGSVLGELYDFADARIIKAGWNWNLANNDGSKGTHNPTFVFEFMDAAIDALYELAAE
jgi:hypothetical protein